jgi:transposase
MSKAQLVITAVVLEGRSKSEVARDYDVSRTWVQQLVKRYESEGAAAFEPHARRPHHSSQAVGAAVEDKIVRLRKPWPNRATTPARPPSPNTSPATPRSPKFLQYRRSGGS